MSSSPAHSLKKRSPRARRERRYLPQPTRQSRLVLGLGAVGSAVLGAGVYAQWLLVEPKPYGQWLVLAGALLLAAVLWLGGTTAHPVRVGDAGVGIERGSELTRLAWCELESVKLTQGLLLLGGKGQLSLSLPLDAHALAAARVLAEATRRVPQVVQLSEEERRRLGTPQDGAVPQHEVVGVQVAGKPCAATQRPIAFEQDARFCLNCGEVYLKGKLPSQCVSCGQATDGAAPTEAG